MYLNYKKSQKQPAIDLRKRGLSYSEIQKQIQVPKSTLSYWFKDIKLTRSQVTHLNQKRLEAGKLGAKRKHESTHKAIEEIRRTSAKAIKEISPRELWLMGIMLYWRERFLQKNDNDIKKGVHFTSSDPDLVRFFLLWLLSVGKLKKTEIAFDLFVNVDKKNKLPTMIEYWSRVTGFSKKSFKNSYFLNTKAHNSVTGKSVESGKLGGSRRVVHKKAKNGLLRIRVKASSMLARQLAGWISGIHKYYWKE